MDETVIRAFFEDLHGGKLDAIAERLHDEVVFEFPGTRFGARVEGKRRVLVFLKQNQRLFRDGLRFDVRWVGVVRDHAVAQWTNAGTTRQGADYRNRGVSVFRAAADGRIIEIQDYLDTEAILTTWPPRSEPPSRS